MKLIGEPVMRVACTPGGPKPTQPGFVPAAEPPEPEATPAWRAREMLDQAELLLAKGQRDEALNVADEALDLAGEGDAEVRERVEKLQGA